MIKYRYARGFHDSAVDVTTLTDTTRYKYAPYACFGCGCEMIANLGVKKTKYFSHKSVGTCNPETYLHNVAKNTFFDLYSRCLKDGTPILLRQKVPGECDHYQEFICQPCKINWLREHDLTRYFTKISLETHIKGVIPDVLLTSKDDRDHLFIEIAVTHKCEPEKINLGLRIIEIEIKKEEDLSVFSDTMFSEDDERIILFNFERRPVRGDLCRGSCSEKVRLFLVYESGKALLKWFQPQELKKVLKNRKLVWKENLGPYDPTISEDIEDNLFRDMVRKAFFDGTPIKNCFNCRYHGLGIYEDPIFCKLRRQGVSSNEAADCTTYKGFQNSSEAERADKGNEDYLLRSQPSWVLNIDKL